jgi:polysaccharide deacetylase family protein (PEP-CTERM system associated)
MKNILTVDCEDWFQTAVSQKYLRDRPNLLPEDCVSRSVNILLGLFRAHDARATFFILGRVAEKFSDLIPMIEKDGHRIGAHGYDHESALGRSASDFDADVEKVTAVLRHLASRPVVSFRAPNWSIGPKNIWAIDILKKHGYHYDSSLKRVIGIMDKRQGEARDIIEIPRSGKMIGRCQIPFGGAFLRLYPLSAIQHFMKELNRQGKPFMVYVHPWEVDAAVPVMKMSWIDRIIQYQGISRNLDKVKSVLSSFEFISIEDFFESKEMNEDHEQSFYFYL